VRSKVFYVPKYEEIKLRACPRPPDKKEIARELVNAGAKQGKNFGIDIDGALPDMAWLLACLSTLNSKHKFFAKDYYPVIKTKEGQLIDNQDQLFTGLPQ
jgi:hypothetical protein